MVHAHAMSWPFVGQPWVPASQGALGVCALMLCPSCQPCRWTRLCSTSPSRCPRFTATKCSGPTWAASSRERLQGPAERPFQAPLVIMHSCCRSLNNRRGSLFWCSACKPSADATCSDRRVRGRESAHPAVHDMSQPAVNIGCRFRGRRNDASETQYQLARITSTARKGERRLQVGAAPQWCLLTSQALQGHVTHEFIACGTGYLHQLAPSAPASLPALAASQHAPPRPHSAPHMPSR